MLDKLWRTIGFGTPMTVTQMLIRAAICIGLCITMLVAGATTTALQWTLIIILAFGAGMWIGRVLGWVDDTMLLEAKIGRAHV